MQEARNCRGKGNKKYQQKLYNDMTVDECPVGLSDRRAVAVINICNMGQGEFGGVQALPSQIMKETKFYFNVRGIINSEEF